MVRNEYHVMQIMPHQHPLLPGEGVRQRCDSYEDAVVAISRLLQQSPTAEFYIRKVFTAAPSANPADNADHL